MQKVIYKRISHGQLIASGKAPSVSKARNPVHAAWNAFDATKAALGDKFTRKAAIDFAMESGVAFYTARTQYQEWKAAGDRDAKASLKQKHGLSKTLVDRYRL
jgi:hypothetical protein